MASHKIGIDYCNGRIGIKCPKDKLLDKLQLTRNKHHRELVIASVIHHWLMRPGRLSM